MASSASCPQPLAASPAPNGNGVTRRQSVASHHSHHSKNTNTNPNPNPSPDHKHQATLLSGPAIALRRKSIPFGSPNGSYHPIPPQNSMATRLGSIASPPAHIGGGSYLINKLEHVAQEGYSPNFTPLVSPAGVSHQFSPPGSLSRDISASLAVYLMGAGIGVGGPLRRGSNAGLRYESPKNTPTHGQSPPAHPPADYFSTPYIRHHAGDEHPQSFRVEGPWTESNKTPNQTESDKTPRGPESPETDEIEDYDQEGDL